MAIPRNAVEFCKLVESRLGWQAPPMPIDARKRDQNYLVMAARVNRAIKQNPDLYTWRNLAAAVELLSREKKSRNPLGVFAHVDRAMDLALDAESDVEQEIRRICAYETSRGDPAGWVVRFARTHPAYRAEAVAEWQESVR